MHCEGIEGLADAVPLAQIKTTPKGQIQQHAEVKDGTRQPGMATAKRCLQYHLSHQSDRSCVATSYPITFTDTLVLF